MSKTNLSIAKAKSKRTFLKLLAKGHPVAFEDAIKHVETPEGYDRRGLSSIVTELIKSRVIVRAGFRQSHRPGHHNATKSLWKLARGVNDV